MAKHSAKSATASNAASSEDQRAWVIPALGGATILSLVFYLWLAWLSQYHTLATDGVDRPILLVIGVYAAAFVPYFLAWWTATHARASKLLLFWLLGTSLLWRAILLPTAPFQEIDIYRYLWDGAVVSQGWDPYEYPPAKVVEAIDLAQANVDYLETDRLLAMVEFATREAPEYETVLRTIHYGELPSPYPPVSQAVFAAASLTSPFSTATGHLAWLKGWLVGFDFATLLVVVWLLKITGKHAGHALAYGWCPLVMKEIAGSGHLDSIATFFAILAVALAVRSVQASAGLGRMGVIAGSAMAVALGVGAKLFPIILAPLLVLVWWRRVGLLQAVAGGAIITVASWALLAPMFTGSSSSSPEPAVAAAAAADKAIPPLPDDEQATTKTAGIAAFLSRWEINDLIFLVVVENLRPQAEVPPQKRPWFVFVPDVVSSMIVSAWQATLGLFWLGAAELTPTQASFLLARLLTLLAFGLIALVCAWKASRPDAKDIDLPWAAFLTLAWFWLLAPTQNPWYWCWAVPLLPFARSRAWALLAACCLMYYLRFWLLYHHPEVWPAEGVLGTSYGGAYYFYFVVVWFEFGPWLLLLAGEWQWRRRRTPRPEPA